MPFRMYLFAKALPVEFILNLLKKRNSTWVQGRRVCIAWKDTYIKNLYIYKKYPA